VNSTCLTYWQDWLSILASYYLRMAWQVSVYLDSLLLRLQAKRCPILLVEQNNFEVLEFHKFCTCLQKRLALSCCRACLGGLHSVAERSDFDGIADECFEKPFKTIIWHELFVVQDVYHICALFE
jgi:hypothetical protein